MRKTSYVGRSLPLILGALAFLLLIGTVLLFFLPWKAEDIPARISAVSAPEPSPAQLPAFSSETSSSPSDDQENAGKSFTQPSMDSASQSTAPAGETSAPQWEQNCTDSKTSSEPDILEELANVPLGALGNTAGNLMNGGLAAEADGWIYFSDPARRGSLSKKPSAGGETVPLNDDTSRLINVIGNWIFYQYDGDFHIHRMRIDGSDDEALLPQDYNAESLTVYEDWLYYIVDGILYRAKADGSGRVKLLTNCGDLNIYNGYLYYKNLVNSGLYQADLNGKGSIKIGNEQINWPLFFENAVYYSNTSNGWLYKMNLDGSGIECLDNTRVESLNAKDGCLYYRSQKSGNKIRVKKLDGSIGSTVGQGVCQQIHVLSGELFYKDDFDYQWTKRTW